MLQRRVWCWASPSGFSRFRFSFPHRDLARPGSWQGRRRRQWGRRKRRRKRRIGGEARGSDKGERGSGFADQGGKHDGKNRSVEFRGGAAAEGGNRGQRRPCRHPRRIPERPPRGEEERAQQYEQPCSGEKSKTASTEKSGKVHEANTRTTVTPAPTTTATTITRRSPPDHLGNLNAANASPRALERPPRIPRRPVVRIHERPLNGVSRLSTGRRSSASREAAVRRRLSLQDSPTRRFHT